MTNYNLKQKLQMIGWIITNAESKCACGTPSDNSRIMPTYFMCKKCVQENASNKLQAKILDIADNKCCDRDNCDCCGSQRCEERKPNKESI